MLLNAVVGMKILKKTILVPIGFTKIWIVTKLFQTVITYINLTSVMINISLSMTVFFYNYDKAEDKSVARTVISDSCKTVADKLNKKYQLVSCSPPSNIEWCWRW